MTALRPDLAKYGIVPGDMIEALEVMLQGVPVTRIIEKERTLEVFLRLDEASRKDIETIKIVFLKINGQPIGNVKNDFFLRNRIDRWKKTKDK